MQTYQKQFIDFAIMKGVLLFGDFKLKSGRISPYFWNSGEFKDGESFQKIGEFYAKCIQTHFPENQYDILFGPAYKGISLATTTAASLAQQFSVNKGVCFNRKEVKDHGEGGMLIGSSLKGKRVLLIDDVITAGTTIRDSIRLIEQEQGKLIGVIISLDRQEKGLKSTLSAIQEVEQEFNLKVISIISLTEIIKYLEQQPAENYKQYLNNIKKYQKEFGVAA